jgi:hypothetical protein
MMAIAEGVPPNIEETTEGETPTGSPQEDSKVVVDAEKDEV